MVYTTDLCRTYRLLAPAGSFVEVGAFSPHYRPGREHRQWNREQDAWPRIGYVRNEADFLAFAERHGGDRMVCCGLNPRSQAYEGPWGYPRAARESEIPASRALLLDLDPDEGKAVLEGVDSLLGRIDEYFQDHGFQVPTVAHSGRGYHLVATYPAISVKDFPKIRGQLATFASGLRGECERELMAEGARLDSTTDLRRLVKVYGTAKPGGLESRIQRFQPDPDPVLREYLLSLLPQPTNGTNGDLPPLEIGSELPTWFESLLDKPTVSKLWDGDGKPVGSDRSRSGYDFSLVRHLIGKGHTDPNELATILALRPDGAFEGRGQDQSYLQRTVSNALTWDRHSKD